MKNKLFINPYYCYMISFGLALVIYSWGWSEIYPTLTVDVIVFLILTFLIAFFLGKRISGKLKYKPIIESENSTKIVFIILCGYSLEFIYNRGIPLISILKGLDIAYIEFGIPTFHVFLLTFSSFYAVYIFHQYLSSTKRKYLLCFTLLLLPYILIVNRAALIMILIACLLLFMSSLIKIAIKTVILILLSASLFLFGFGYLGNARSFNNDPTAFLTLTKATDSFTESIIPKEYYWFYIYASSPFANFQNVVLTSVTHRYDVPAFITWEFLPDFLSKRIIPQEYDYDAITRLDYSINPLLTVGSIYFDPFIRLGWIGPIAVFLFYALLVYLYVLILPSNSKYFLSGIAILCVISIFNVFGNMLNFSGLSVQLVYPILFHKLGNIKLVGFKWITLRFKYNFPKIRLRL